MNITLEKTVAWSFIICGVAVDAGCIYVWKENAANILTYIAASGGTAMGILGGINLRGIYKDKKEEEQRELARQEAIAAQLARQQQQIIRR